MIEQSFSFASEDVQSVALQTLVKTTACQGHIVPGIARKLVLNTMVNLIEAGPGTVMVDPQEIHDVAHLSLIHI